MKKFDIHRYWIPGKNMYGVFVPLGIWTFVYLMVSISNMSRRLLEHLRLLDWKYTYGHLGCENTIADPSRKMAPYSEVIKGAFAGYWIVLLICVIFIFGRYLQLRRDRSIYIMKRVPAVETFRRCAPVLLIYAAAVLVLSMVIAAIYKLRYIELVPAEVMPAKESILWVFKALVPAKGGLRGLFF